MIHNFDLTPLTDASYEGVTIANAMIAFPHGEARGEITKLINGSTYIHNAGYYHHDRVATITGRVTVAQAEKLVDFLKDEVTLYFSDELATYSCFVQSLDVANGALNMTLKIIGILMAFADIVYPPAPVPVPPVPPEEWVDVTSDAYWTSAGLIWDGINWTLVTSDYETILALSPAGTWASGFRPTRARITYAAHITCYVDWLDIQPAIYSSGVPASGVAFDISTEVYDIGSATIELAIYHTAYNPPDELIFAIDKIEFYGIKTW